jgi:hypothetical protein
VVKVKKFLGNWEGVTTTPSRSQPPFRRSRLRRSASPCPPR